MFDCDVHMLALVSAARFCQHALKLGHAHQLRSDLPRREHKHCIIDLCRYSTLMGGWLNKAQRSSDRFFVYCFCFLLLLFHGERFLFMLCSVQTIQTGIGMDKLNMKIYFFLKVGNWEFDSGMTFIEWFYSFYLLISLNPYFFILELLSF